MYVYVRYCSDEGGKKKKDKQRGEIYVKGCVCDYAKGAAVIMCTL